MTPLAVAVSKALIHFFWQGSIVGLSLWVVLYALRKKSAASRYAAGCAALAVLVLMPLVTTVALYTGTLGETATTVMPSASAPVSLVEAVSADGQRAWLTWVISWALPAWSVGVVIFSIRFVIGYRHAFHLRRAAASACESVVEAVRRIGTVMGVERPIRVLVSTMSDSPSVVGWLRPVILLPTATLAGLTPFQLEAILAHEIGHIKRYDYLVNILQMAVETLLFYHPAVWWTSRRIRIERELCCDDLAVGFSGNALGYARALTVLEKLRLRAPLVAMASTGGPLMYRIQRLAGVGGKEYGASRLPILAAVAVGVLCLMINVDWMRGQDAPGIKVDLGASRVIHREPVRYPEAAKKQGVTGTVQVEVKLDSSGNVTDARVTTGPEELRKAALQSVLNWHFSSDAARTTRVVAISFSGQEPQTQGREPEVGRTEGELLKEEDKRGLINDLARQYREAEIAKAIETTAFHSSREQVEKELEALRRSFEGLADTRNNILSDRRAMQESLLALETELQASRQRQEGLADARNDLLASRREMEQRLAAVQADLQAVRQRGEQDVQRDLLLNGLSKMEQKLAELAEVEAKIRQSELRGDLFADRPLQEILTPGLSETVRNELIARLPVRIGDVLTPEKVDETKAAVRAYDEHLAVRFLISGDHSQLRIAK